MTAPDIARRTIAEHHDRRVIDAGRTRFNISSAGRWDGQPLAAVIPLDDMAPERLAAALRFWTALTQAEPPPDDRITPQRRQRLRQMIRAVDGRQRGHSYREIAESLFPSHHIVPRAWRGDALRETTIRLVRDGLGLVEQGYRRLMRKPRRPD